jgi:site-specific DNA recombinase
LAERDDANLKGRIVELRRIRDSARADAERADVSDSRSVEITPDVPSRFADEARRRIRTAEGKAQALC